MKPIRLFILAFCLVFVFGCSHALQITNLDSFAVPISSSEKIIELGITPFKGNAEGVWYFNAVVEKLQSELKIEILSTNFVPGQSKLDPDYVVSIDPVVNYESSGWNFLINWPGFLIFTPAWNGYVYYANVNTDVTISDGNGRVIKKLKLDTPYSIREAEFDRTVWTELGWFSYSALAFFGGIYDAIVFDTDITNSFRFAVKDNYANYVVTRTMGEIRMLRH